MNLRLQPFAHCRRWFSRRRLTNPAHGAYSVICAPGKVSPFREVPGHIKCPHYAHTGNPDISADGCPIKYDLVKPEWKIQKIRAACQLARLVLNSVGSEVKEGVTTDQLDAYAHEITTSHGAYPSPLNYHGFPKSICTSVNNVACHGIPDDWRLRDGDIVSVDVTVYLDGVHGDCCDTFTVGNVDDAGLQLVKAARECLLSGISACSPGSPFSAIGRSVEHAAQKNKVTVVPCFLGHGIGSNFHEPPDVYHFDTEEGDLVQTENGSESPVILSMAEGMTFTVEPVITQGSPDVVILEDGWTAVMLDNSRAAQFEHTVLVTSNGIEILTA